MGHDLYCSDPQLFLDEFTDISKEEQVKRAKEEKERREKLEKVLEGVQRESKDEQKKKEEGKKKNKRMRQYKALLLREH